MKQTLLHLAYDVEQPYLYRLLLDYERDGIVVPIDYIFDGASTPWWSWSLFPRFGTVAAAALIHDYCYLNDVNFTRKEVDDMFYRHMVEDGTEKWRAWIMWAAVRCGGGKWWQTPYTYSGLL